MTVNKLKSSSAHPLKTIWNVITWLLVAVAVLTAMALVGVRLFGLQPYSVLSGSMEPTYKTGSVVYVKKVDYHTLRVGDPVTFLLDENTVVTHRIVEIIPDEEEPDVLRFRTKGDNNESADGGLVHCRNIIGTPIFTVPYLGYVASYIQRPPGTYIAIAAAAILILMTFLSESSNEKSKEKQQAG